MGIFPAEYEQRIKLASGQTGVVQLWDHDGIWILWDDGELFPIPVEDFDTLTATGGLVVLWRIPDLEFPTG